MGLESQGHRFPAVFTWASFTSPSLSVHIYKVGTTVNIVRRPREDERACKHRALTSDIRITARAEEGVMPALRGAA